MEVDPGDSDGRGVGGAAVDRDTARVQAAVRPPSRGLPTPGGGESPAEASRQGGSGNRAPRGRGEEGEPSADQVGADLGLALNGGHRQVMSRGRTRSHPLCGLWAEAWRVGCREGTARPMLPECVSDVDQGGHRGNEERWDETGWGLADWLEERWKVWVGSRDPD